MKRFLVPALALSCLVFTVAGIFAGYSFGWTEGTGWGYSEGLRVADAWEKRAKQCEGITIGGSTVGMTGTTFTPSQVSTIGSLLSAVPDGSVRECSDCVVSSGPCRQGKPSWPPKVLAMKVGGKWECTPLR